MKRLILRLILLTFTLSILISLCSCDKDVSKIVGIFIKPVHEHSFSPDWCSDADYHWHEATCEHKDQLDKKEPHSFTSWEISKAPDCINGGEETRKCKECGFSEKRQVPSTGHNFENPVITPPTCENDGYTTLTCSCGVESIIDILPSLGHSMGDWYVVTEKSCTEDGINQRNCVREGCEYFELGKTDASHEYTASVTLPTCESKGYTTYTCSCGNSYIDGYTDATGHSITSHEKKEPTCTEVGWDAYESCSVCDYTTYIEKEKLGHTYSSETVNPTCTEQGYTTYTCRCGDSYTDDYVASLGHQKVVTDKPIQPTCEESGLSEGAYCSVCEEVISVQTVIPARGYDWILEDGEFKILLIGNSYTEDASNCGQGVKDSQLYHIIQSMVGEDVKVTVGVIVSGGKGLNWHATKAENNTVAYTLQVTSTDNPLWKSVKRVTSAEALEWTNWDFVSLQPYSINVSTGIESNAYPAETDSKYAHISDSVKYLLDFVHKHAPSAEAYLYMHWAQTSAIALNANLSYYNRMAAFYPSVLEYQGTESGKRFSSLVPVGLSIQNARTTYLSLLAYNTTAYADKNLSYTTDAQIGLQRDGGHVSFNIGRYIAALTFAEMVVPESLRAENYHLPDIRITESIGRLPREYTEIAQKSVMAAVGGWKNGSLAVTVIEGYEKDPTTIFAERFASGLSFECSLNTDKIKAKITEFLNEQLIEDLVIEKIEIPESIEDGSPFKTTVTVRFGYTTLKFDIDATVSVTLSEIFGGLTYVTFGDSITYGIDGVDWGKMAEPYPNLVTEALEIGRLNNLAVSGATFCKNELGRTNMTAKILAFTGEADIISLMLGVNDFYVGLPLGTPDCKDNTTIYGSLYLISEYLTTNYDNAYIFYMTPFPAKRGYTENSQGYLLKDVADAIKYVAEIYGIPVLDMYEVSEYEDVEMNNPNGDGLHPSQGFMKDYAAPKISEFIKENYR